VRTENRVRAEEKNGRKRKYWDKRESCTVTVAKRVREKEKGERGF
jgi:hypothetical protein